MSEKRFMNAYELGEIIRRHELANDGNPLRDIDVLNAMYDSLDDIPKLLEEIERLKRKLSLIEQTAIHPVNEGMDYVPIEICYEIHIHAKEVEGN